MALRTQENATYDPPPAGTIRIVFWRHLTETSNDPEILTLHQERAKIVHELVRTADLEVRDWGTVDAEYPSEDVWAYVELFLSPAAALIVNELVRLIKTRRKNEQRVLKGVTFQRADGAELKFSEREPLSAEDTLAVLEAFLADGKGSPRKRRS